MSDNIRFFTQKLYHAAALLSIHKFESRKTKKAASKDRVAAQPL